MIGPQSRRAIGCLQQCCRVLREILAIARCIGARINADNDKARQVARIMQFLRGFIGTPFLPVPRLARVKQHLPIMHINDAIGGMGGVIIRCPNADRARRIILRRKIINMGDLA